METFSALLAFCAGNSTVTGEFLAQRPVRRGFDVSFDLRLNKEWRNNREAGDLRRHRAHYDVSVMMDIYHMWLPFRMLNLGNEVIWIATRKIQNMQQRTR